APAVVVIERHHQRLDRDAFALSQTGHLLAELDHFGREFVTEDLRQCGAGEVMRVHGGDDRAGGIFVKVSPADPAHLRFDDDLLRTWTRRRRDLLDADIFLAIIANRFHVSLPSLSRRAESLPGPQTPARRRAAE